MDKMRQNFKRRADISCLRICATIAVVFLHTCNTLTSNVESFQLTEGQLYLYTVCHKIMNWGVPSFIMITGILMLRRERVLTVKDVLTKYCKRIFIALFLFGTVFSMLEMVMTERSFRVAMIWEAIINVLNRQSWGHLWYLYMLIGLYLTMPLLKVFTENASKQVMKFTIAVIFGFVWLVPIMNLSGLKLGFELPIATYVLFYPLVGFYLDNYVQNIAKNKLFFTIQALAAVAGICFLSYSDWNGAESIENVLYVLLTVSIYVILKNIHVKNSARLWRIDRLCFGVYLIHPFFINLTYKALKITPAKFGSSVLAVIAFGLCFTVLSYGASWCLRQIKPLRKYIL